MNNGVFGSSVVGVGCPQVITTKANLGPHGTFVSSFYTAWNPIYLIISQIAVSPSYQTSYGSLPFASVGKLAGLPFKLQFYNAFKYENSLIVRF